MNTLTIDKQNGCTSVSLQDKKAQQKGWTIVSKLVTSNETYVVHLFNYIVLLTWGQLQFQLCSSRV